jgi:hypothetical protein
VSKPHNPRKQAQDMYLAGCGKIVLGERFFALVASFRQS